MAHLIDKDALVAEIERIKEMYCYDTKTNASFVAEAVINSINNAIDSLEVKEVDLEKELIEWHKEHFKKDRTFIGMSGFYLTNNSQMDFAKHFFELGMQVSNKSHNVWHNADEKLPLGVIVVSNYGHLHIGWATDEGDGIEDEHGCLITKTYQKWAREKGLT